MLFFGFVLSLIYGLLLFVFQAPDAQGSVVVQPETNAEDVGQVPNQFR